MSDRLKPRPSFSSRKLARFSMVAILGVSHMSSEYEPPRYPPTESCEFFGRQIYGVSSIKVRVPEAVTKGAFIHGAAGVPEDVERKLDNHRQIVMVNIGPVEYHIATIWGNAKSAPGLAQTSIQKNGTGIECKVERIVLNGNVIKRSEPLQRTSTPGGADVSASNGRMDSHERLPHPS